MLAFASYGTFDTMKHHTSLKRWWQPLSVWLKAATLLIGFLAWLFIVYCVLSGQAKSFAAFVAFLVCAAVTSLHIIFDHRNRRGHHERSGLDVSNDGE